MGTWDPSSFGNDVACDWVYALEKADDPSVLEDALRAVMELASDTSIDAELGERAVAAAEVVARMGGQWGEETSYTESADAWVRAHPNLLTAELLQRAQEALGRVLGPTSELRDLWDEQGDDSWLQAMEELMGRLARVIL